MMKMLTPIMMVMSEAVTNRVENNREEQNSAKQSRTEWGM